jgi:hypothetical protein
MDEETIKAAPDYKVVCAWCGVVFERAWAKDSYGMCPECFARMWDEYSRPHTESGVPHWASER